MRGTAEVWPGATETQRRRWMEKPDSTPSTSSNPSSAMFWLWALSSRFLPLSPIYKVGIITLACHREAGMIEWVVSLQFSPSTQRRVHTQETGTTGIWCPNLNLQKHAFASHFPLAWKDEKESHSSEGGERDRDILFPLYTWTNGAANFRGQE